MIDKSEGWKVLREWLKRRRKVSLPRGRPFQVGFEERRDEIIIVPAESGIERRVSRPEWDRFVDKFNSVEESRYDPLRPGHYARLTFNSSYLVALVKAAELGN